MKYPLTGLIVGDSRTYINSCKCCRLGSDRDRSFHQLCLICEIRICIEYACIPSICHNVKFECKRNIIKVYIISRCNINMHITICTIIYSFYITTYISE